MEPKLDPHTASVVLGILAPIVVMGQFAKWSIYLTVLFLLAHLIVGLPFHFMWGFALVPVGAVFAVIASKVGRFELQKIVEPKDEDNNRPKGPWNQ